MLRPALIAIVSTSLAAAQEKITFDAHVLPIFQQACLNCHNPDKTKGGLDLSSYSTTMKGGSGGRIAEPGDAGSRLLAVVMRTAEPVMPPEGEKLPNEHIATLRRWIEGGLLENADSTARKPAKPKFEAMRTDPAGKPDGPPPMPEHVLLDPPVVTARASAVHAIAASPWAPLVAVTGQKQVLLHHAETLEPAGILPFPEGDPVSLAFTPDGRYLIVGGGVPGKSGLTVTFDVTNGSRLLSAAREFDSVLAADIRPGFDLVATGGPSRLLKIWNTESGEPVKSIKKHTDWITALDISPDGVLLASGDRNGGVWVWESDTGAEFHTLRAHQAGITHLVFRADSNILASSSEDGTVRFWEMNGGSEVKKIDAHPGGVTAFSFARDGSSVTTGRDMKAKLWKADFNHARDLAQNLPALPTAAALDGEGKRAFIGDARGMVIVFNAADAKPLGEFSTNPPTIASRLETLGSRIREADQQIAKLQKNLGERSAARDQAAKELADADKARQQAVEIHKAARTGAAQTPDDAHKQLAEDAAARIAATEQAIPPKRAALEAADKAVSDARKALEQAQAALPALHASRKHWNAAALNTRLLETRRLAEQSAREIETAHTTFTEAARKLEHLADNLNRKRAERDALTAIGAGLSPAALAEREATLAAIDLMIGRELETYRAGELEFAKLADSINPATRLAAEKKAETEFLQHAYHQARE